MDLRTPDKTETVELTHAELEEIVSALYEAEPGGSTLCARLEALVYYEPGDLTKIALPAMHGVTTDEYSALLQKHAQRFGMTLDEFGVPHG